MTVILMESPQDRHKLPGSQHDKVELRWVTLVPGLIAPILVKNEYLRIMVQFTAFRRSFAVIIPTTFSPETTGKPLIL